MAEPCKVHLDQRRIRRMYSTITSAVSLCFSEQSDSAYIENVCCYQEVLSGILCHMSDITIEQINVLVQLSVYTIKRFPDIIESKNPLVISALIRTISNLGIINRNLLQRYLDSIIYDGIAWSCSHTLAVDAELQWEQKNLRQRPVCNKNYLPLWTALLNAHKYRTGEREQLAQHVANTLMDNCITLIDRLDIRVEEARENVDAHSDAIFPQNLAVNQADFHVFTNLVDLYVDVIEASESSLFANTVQRFLYEIIRLSYKHPLVSGFYKLARVGMKIVVTLEGEEESRELRQAKECLSNYLTYTLDLLPAFSNELLIAYLHLILNAPLAYIKDALPRMLPVLKIAFTVGLSDLELAYTALGTLETWTMSQKPEQKEHTNELLHEVVAYLEPYLRSTESSAEISQDLTTETARKHVKRVHVIDTECTLRNFQRRVLLFFGSLNHDLLSNFVHERASRSTGASWDSKRCLKYSLPLPDARPDIYFDRALPRIIALARDSSDRRTKIAACEVLYSMMTLVIGNTARHLVDPDNSFITLYGVLCPTVLALGCDFDEAVRNLFEPLTLQLIRWLSSKSMLTLPVISYLLDSLFDGLTDDSNPALRDFSGKCLGEFTFSLFQKADTRSNVHQIVQRIIQRMNYLALLPSTHKRVAAAVAFNHLYRILREHDEIVSIYWLEIFYCFVRSSDGCDDLSIANALTHVERVMKAKADLLNVNESRRRKPREFDDATLVHALHWLLSQCGALDERYRSKCMKLYVNVSKYNDNHARETTRGFIATYGIERLNGIILGGLELYDEGVSAIDNPTPLLKALDCYAWLIKKPIENPSIEERLLSAEELFSDAGEHAIFSRIRNFAQQFWQTIAESSTETFASRELQTLQMLRCRTLMAAFDFMQELLNVNALPESLWAEEALSALMIKCIMHPRAVGFNVGNIEMTNKLPHVLEILLNSMRSKFGDALPNVFKTHLSHFVHRYLTELLDLQYIMQSDSCDEMIQHVKGLILLKRCNVFDRTISEISAFKNGEDTIVRIFRFLVTECDGELTCSDLSAQMIEYLSTLMEFQFSQLSLTLESPTILIPDDTRSMIETLVKLISDNTPITGLDSASITHGEHFLNTFRSVIFKCMLANTSAITIVFDSMSRNNPSFLLKWIEDLLLFLKRRRRELRDHVDTAVRSILQQFTCLQCTVGEIDSRRERLVNIYGVAVHLRSEIAREFPELREWILSQLIGNGDLEYKMRILRNFLVCLTDAPDRDDKNLSGILNTLRTNEAAKRVSCFEILLTLLSSTKSIITLKFAIHFAAGDGARLFDEKLEEHLRKYYRGTSGEHALRSLEMTYREFMNTETKDGTERLDILRGFLLPPFEFCDAVAIERFFEQNVLELDKITKEPVDNNCDDVAIKRSLLSKIGCFQLIATMFGRAQNVLHKITTNKVLYKSLLQNTVYTRDVRIPRCKELARLMHCSAYNCFLALISVKEREEFYKMAFGKNTAKNKADNVFIWEIIVDRDKRYRLGQTFTEYPKIRETVVSVKSADDERGMRGNSYTHTFDLSACTLNEDINAYDFNRCVVLPYGSRYLASQGWSQCSWQSVTSVALESDDFNEHECMPHVCALLRRARQISGSCDISPPWLECFLAAMTLKEPNIKLFLLKIISNTADVFKYYAKFALTPIIESAAAYLLERKHDVNYIITDILEILMDTEIVPSDANGRAQAQRLFARFVDKVMTKRSEIDHVNDYNFRLMSDMAKKWRDCLTVPIEFAEKMSSAPQAAVHLILAFFETGTTEEIIVKEDVVNFLLKHLPDWHGEAKAEKMSLNCSKCLGLYLKILDNIVDNESERENRRRALSARISNVLGVSRKPEHLAKQVKCIAALCQFYPEAAASYIAVAINAMAKRVETSGCLEIFRLAMPQLGAEDVVDHLRHMRLQQVLENRMHCEKLVLRVVHDLVTVLSPVDLLPYVNRAIPYVKDGSTESRELVYQILTNVYKRYLTYNALDDQVTVQTLLSVSVQNLLAGLLDPSRDLQEKILHFWAEETDFSAQRSKDRLLALLDMRLPRWTTSQDVFALFVALLMLQLSTKSTEYNKKIFDAPLHRNCTFRDRRIEISCQRRNLSSVTPMFVKSFASQMMTYGAFSQSVDSDVTAAHFSHDAAKPRAMQDWQFEPTLDEEAAANATAAFSASSLDAEFDRATTAPNRSRQETIARDKRFPRFLANKSEVSKDMRNKNYRKNKQRAEMMNQETVRQRSSVKLNNNYRSGDYPDIEITHSSFIVPLQQLIKLDRLFCKHVTVFLLESLSQEMIEKENSEDFRQAIVEKLNRILHNSCDRESSINAIILETFLNLKVTSCDPRDIIRASKTNGLDVLGLFLLEHFLSNIWDDDSSPTSSKKMRVQDNYMENEKIDRWAQLASFYKSLNDVDVVLSIFRERQFLGEAVQEAALAEANGDWARARDAFSRAYEQSGNSSMKEHCLQGLLEAVNNLCDWSEIDRLVKSRSADKFLGDLWDDAWKDWMIPYAFDAYVHMTAEGIWKADHDLTIIQSWMCNAEKLEHLKFLIGEDLIIFLMRTEQDKATDLLNNLLDKAGEQWIRLSPLCTELGIRKLQKLQIMNDLDASLKPLRCARINHLDRMTALLNFWSTKMPKMQDNLVQWNKLAACRTYSSILLEYMCDELWGDELWGDENKSEIRQRMRRMNFQLRLDIGDAALKQKHRYIAEKHLTYLKGVCNLGEELPLKWFEARTRYVVADVETDVSKKMAGYAASWEHSHSLLNESGELDAGLSTAIRKHIGAMASKLESLSGEDEFAHALMSKTAILRDVGIAEPTRVNPDDVKRQLLQYSLNNFRLCCEHAAATDVGEHYCALARHCYGRLIVAESDGMFREFLHSVLKSMSHSYFEATHYFPCLLRPERLQDERTRETFARECAELQPWLFLRWRDLLFSHLGTWSIADLVRPIVERLAEKYPDAIAYTYHHAVERNPEALQDGRAQRIRSLLGDKAERYKRILQAIQYVAQPLLYLKYHVDELTKELSRGNATMVESLWRRVSSILDAQAMNKPRPGKSYDKITKFVKTIKALDLNNRDAVREELERMKRDLMPFLENLKGGRHELSDFSPFLLEFTGDDIEIPGQYSDDGQPMPRYHAKLAGFEPDVTIMPSLRKPIRIGMIGDDGRKYKFLVKFGEDLTIDRGLQQLFATMNRTLRNDVSCGQRRLAVDTYEVIPLSRSFGLIQWIEDTKSLEDLIQFSLSQKDNAQCEGIRKNYSEWIRKAAPVKCRIPDLYKEAVSKYSQQEVTKKMEHLITRTKQTALRQTFVTVSSSSECFVTLRRNFIASYATMCVAHWLAGVGDRHLQNTLVRATGRCLGIDFGHAFGAGIRAPVPELVPFRLTPQILKLLQPFTERDLLATIMIHAMRALRNDRGPILACMDIFIHKPANRSAMINDDEGNADIDADSTWSFRKNIEIVAQKLNGIHPSFITLKQLKEAHDNEYFMRYRAIVSGEDGPKQARANMKNNYLTPAEQVDCLLDQARDLNILGRMYVNWQPWL
nr:PREDICTED: LOW QUALITY PROTEIN: DNA-dependent protein kinase catalytic subunit-like [Linepithema humile]